jgi:hypothetical protein
MPAYTLTAAERAYLIACCDAAAPAWGEGVKAIATSARAMKGSGINLTEKDRQALESLLPMPFELEEVSDRGQLMRLDMGRLRSVVGNPVADCKVVFLKFHKPPAPTFDDVFGDDPEEEERIHDQLMRHQAAHPTTGGE